MGPFVSRTLHLLQGNSDYDLYIPSSAAEKKWKHLPQSMVKQIKYHNKKSECVNKYIYHVLLCDIYICLHTQTLCSVFSAYDLTHFPFLCHEKDAKQKLTPGNTWHSFQANFVLSLAETAHLEPLIKGCLQQGRGNIFISESPAVLYSLIFIKTRPCLLVLLASRSGFFFKLLQF